MNSLLIRSAVNISTEPGDRVVESAETYQKSHDVDRDDLADCRRCGEDQPGAERHQPAREDRTDDER